MIPQKGGITKVQHYQIPVAKRTNVDIKYTGLSGNEEGFQYETVTGTQLAAVRSEKNDPKSR